MITANLFARYPRIARTIASRNAAWLSYNREHVLQMAADCGIDPVEIAAAIAHDTSEYLPTPPDAPVRVDVIIPFCEADSRYLSECIQSIADQRHAQPTIHVIADGCDWPQLPVMRPAIRLHRYATTGGWGPYIIANAVVSGGHCDTPYLAIQDADDTSHPDRLWRQVQLLRHHDADMISSSMQQTAEPCCTDEALHRMRREPVLRAGTAYLSAPFGRVVNSTRTMRVAWFRKLNGFADLFCGADFDFDNRSHLFGGNTIHDQQIMATRRLHVGSLTTAPLYAIGSPARNATNQTVLDNLQACRRDPSTVFSFGGLHSAPPLRPLHAIDASRFVIS